MNKDCLTQKCTLICEIKSRTNHYFCRTNSILNFHRTFFSPNLPNLLFWKNVLRECFHPICSVADAAALQPFCHRAYIDIDNISTYIDIEINVGSIPKFACMFVCLFIFLWHRYRSHQWSYNNEIWHEGSLREILKTVFFVFWNFDYFLS